MILDRLIDWPRVRVGGLNTWCITGAELAERMVADCMAARSMRGVSEAAVVAKSSPVCVFSANGQSLALSWTNATFRAAMEEADIIHADGMSVVKASKIMCPRPLPERISTTDFIHDACAVAERAGLSFYLLGGNDGANKATVSYLREKYPNLRIVGRHHGYYDASDEAAVIEDIQQVDPDVLWVALGKPRQEYDALRFRDALPNVGWIKTCGGMLDYYGGGIPRAPIWVQKIGFEWSWRILQEPRRLAWRYLTTNMIAIWAILRDSGAATPSKKVSDP